jgi:hypothetical protein
MASSKDIETLISRLASAPARFAAALSRLEDADSVMGGSAEEWSPADVLAHVRASQDILEPRILQILVRDNPPLVAFDDRRWEDVARYASLPIIDSLEAMSLRRSELVRALRTIPEADWQRTGTHEINGPQSVLQIAQHIANHEDEHIAQIEEVVMRNA